MFVVGFIPCWYSCPTIFRTYFYIINKKRLKGKRRMTDNKSVNRTFLLRWPASLKIYRNKKCLHKKRVQLPKDWFDTPIWPLWCHVKTLYTNFILNPITAFNREELITFIHTYMHTYIHTFTLFNLEFKVAKDKLVSSIFELQVWF